MTVRLSASARRDVDAIWDYLAEHGGIATAERFVWRLSDLFLLLGRHPLMGTLVPKIADGVRRFPLGDYLVYYTIQRRRIQISRVTRGARRQQKALRETPA